MSHPSDCAVQIVAEIVADMSDRRGLRQQWDHIDDDVRLEIIGTWERIVRDHLLAFRKAGGEL